MPLATNCGPWHQLFHNLEMVAKWHGGASQENHRLDGVITEQLFSAIAQHNGTHLLTLTLPLLRVFVAAFFAPKPCSCSL